jgi:hypothetical protein
MRKIVILLVVLMLITGFSVKAQATDTVNVIVDGRKIEFTDAPAYVDNNGRTQVPTRFVGEALGALVEYEDEIRAVTFSRRSQAFEESSILSIRIVIGSEDYYTQLDTSEEAIKHTMDTKAVLEQGRTYIPVRYIAETYGAKVKWDPETNTVTITSKTKEFRGFEVPQSFTGGVYNIKYDDDEDYRGVVFELGSDGSRGAASLENRVDLLCHILSQKLEQYSIDMLKKFIAGDCGCEKEISADSVANTFLDKKTGQYVRIYNSTGDFFTVVIYDKGFTPPGNFGF